jgi:hypothetical protein
MIRAAVRVALLAAAFALGCFALGWWSAAPIGVLWGWLGRSGGRDSVLLAGLGAAIGWSTLLGWTAIVGEAGTLIMTMSALFGLPGLLLPVVTVTIGGVLAVLGSWVGGGFTGPAPASA